MVLLQEWNTGCDLSGVVANEHLGQHPPVLSRGISFVDGSRHLYILYCIEMQWLATVINSAYTAT